MPFACFYINAQNPLVSFLFFQSLWPALHVNVHPATTTIMALRPDLPPPPAFSFFPYLFPPPPAFLAMHYLNNLAAKPVPALAPPAPPLAPPAAANLHLPHCGRSRQAWACSAEARRLNSPFSKANRRHNARLHSAGLSHINTLDLIHSSKEDFYRILITNSMTEEQSLLCKSIRDKGRHTVSVHAVQLKNGKSPIDGLPPPFSRRACSGTSARREQSARSSQDKTLS